MKWSDLNLSEFLYYLQQQYALNHRENTKQESDGSGFGLQLYSYWLCDFGKVGETQSIISLIQ